MTWLKYRDGSFSQPGVFLEPGGSAAEAGTGGQFSPLYANGRNFVESVANVTYVPAQKLWLLVAVRQPGGAIIERQSQDALHWSEARELLRPDTPNIQFMYARLLATLVGNQEQLVLVWLQRVAKDWKSATEMRQNVSFSRPAAPRHLNTQ